jgi:peptide-methionine (S)-S-oxide reductase
VVTELTPVGDFWQAEPEHQDYLERYPAGYTCRLHLPFPAGYACHFPRPNWKVPKREDNRRTG